MKKHSRKLNLNRETLIPLQDDALDQIQGGLVQSLPPMTPATSGLSRQIASHVVRSAVRTYQMWTQMSKPQAGGQ